MRAMVIKEFRELARDRRTLLLIIVVPLFLLTIFGYAANFSVDSSKVLLAGKGAEDLAAELADNSVAQENLVLESTNTELTEEAITEQLRNEKYDAVFLISDDSDQTLIKRGHLWVNGSKLFTAESVRGVWAQVVFEDIGNRAKELKEEIAQIRADAEKASTQATELREKLTQLKEKLTKLRQGFATGQIRGLPEIPALPADDEFPKMPDISEFPDMDVIDIEDLDIDEHVTVLFNPDLHTSWVMVPGLTGLILTFIGTVVTSIGLVRERESGTLEQLAAMPLSPAAIIIGKIVPYFVLSLFDMALITTVGVWVFGVPFEGSIWLFALLVTIFLFVVLGLGVLVSAVSQTTGQAIQLAIMMVMPQVLLSGLIFPLESMAAGVRWIGYLLPLTWFNKAAKAIMLMDASLVEIANPLLILTGLATVIFGMATIRMAALLRNGGVRK